MPAAGYAVAVAIPVTALALLAREQVGFVITFDKNAIAAATDITRANPGLYTALVWWQEALQPRWFYLVGTAVAAWIWWRHGPPPRKGIVSAGGAPMKSRAIWGFVIVAGLLLLLTALVVLIGIVLVKKVRIPKATINSAKQIPAALKPGD